MLQQAEPHLESCLLNGVHNEGLAADVGLGHLIVGQELGAIVEHEHYENCRHEHVVERLDSK